MSRVLVIDDDDSIRQVIIAALRNAGYTVSEASSGEEGLKAFRVEPADLVITDILMPHPDGIEIAMELKAEFPDTPIIAMSGTSSYSQLYLHTVKKLGVMEVLAKPFTMSELMSAVTRLLPLKDGSKSAS